MLFLFFSCTTVLPNISHLQKIRSFKFDLVKYNCSLSVLCGQSIIFLKHKFLFNAIFMKPSFRMYAAFRSIKHRFQKTLFSKEKMSVCIPIWKHTQRQSSNLHTSLIYVGLETVVWAWFKFMLLSKVFILIDSLIEKFRTEIRLSDYYCIKVIKYIEKNSVDFRYWN